MVNYNKKTSSIFNVPNSILMLAVIFLTLFPFLHIIAIAFNTGADTDRGFITIYPRAFTLDNFKLVFSANGFVSSCIVSVGRTLIGTILTLIVTFGAAYAFTRRELPGRKFFIGFVMLPMFFSGGLIPYYILVTLSGLPNNFLVYILPTLFGVFNMIVMRTYIGSAIPEGIEESAKMDGANELQIFFRIMIPLCKPILATVAIWVAVYHWNDWTTSLYFVSKPSMHTLQYKLYQLMQDAQRMTEMILNAAMMGGAITRRPPPQESMVAAQIVITTIPIIIIYPFLQRYFVKGVAIGSIKG